VTRVAMLTIYTNESPPTARLSVWPCCCRVLRALTAAKCLDLARQRRCSGDARAPQRLRRQRLRRVGAAAQPPAATASAAPETSGDRQQQQARRRTVENVELSSHVSTEQEMNHEQAHEWAAGRRRAVCSV
jgi:hypothetical protein